MSGIVVLKGMEELIQEAENKVNIIEGRIHKQEAESYVRTAAICSGWNETEVDELKDIYRKYVSLRIADRIKQSSFDIVKDGPEFFKTVVEDFFTKVVKVPYAHYFYDFTYASISPDNLIIHGVSISDEEAMQINSELSKISSSYVDNAYDKQKEKENEQIIAEFKSKTTMKEKEEMAKKYIVAEYGRKLGDSYELISVLYGEAIGNRFNDENIGKLPLEDQAIIYYMDMLTSHTAVQLNYEFKHTTGNFGLSKRFRYDSSALQIMDSGIHSYKKNKELKEKLGITEEFERMPITFEEDVSFEDAKNIVISLLLSGQDGVVGIYQDVEIRPQDLLDAPNWKKVTYEDLLEKQKAKEETPKMNY